MADFAMHEETHPDTPRIPAWFRKEPPVAILEDSDFGLYWDNDDEIGIQQTDYSHVEFVNSEAAFLFGQSPEELYFRLNFSAVIKIPCCPGPEERKIREKLYNKQRAAFRDHRGMIATTFHGIAIYKDALAMLPLEPSTELAGNASASPETAIAVDGDGEEEEGRQGELFSEPTLEIDGEIQSAIDAELVLRQGRLYGRHRMDGDSACNFDIAFMENRLFVIVYGDAAGTWLADEDSFDESPPLWFSETTHRTSPVNQARRCRDFIQQSIPAVTVVAMVVLGPKVYILNEDEMLTLWKEKCLVHVAQTRQDPESQIPSLHDCLSSLPEADAEPSAQAVEALQNVTKILERNPLAWENQTP